MSESEGREIQTIIVEPPTYHPNHIGSIRKPEEVALLWERIEMLEERLLRAEARIEKLLAATQTYAP
jgi:hypothetical protein